MVFEIYNVRLPQNAENEDAQRLYTVRCEGDRVVEVQGRTTDEVGANPEVAESNNIDGRGGLLLPSLCHSHIHLDKCYILDRGEPLTTGDFAEALRVTSDVKATFKDNTADLYARGDRLVRASVEAGVTSMRAHVEVDKTVGDVCLDVGLKLKDAWSGICDIHIAMFMQDPIFDGPEELLPGTNASVFTEALQRVPLPTAVGSAPYVERTRAQQLANICFILTLAIQHDLHADFHLDYDLTPLPESADSDSAPLIYYLLAQLHELRWAERMPGRTVVVGHATRLTLFSAAQLRDLRARIGDLPVFFVGLPQSDVYMMGRGCAALPPRGTLDVRRLRAEYGLRVAMAVNNVGNAFTPQGAPDPLGLCMLGVALYQDGTATGCRHLVEAVSIDSRRAIGDVWPGTAPSLGPRAGSSADFVILHDNRTVQSAALDPCHDRTTIKGGKVVAWRKAQRWVSGRS
ncbi:hypothetical protein M0805_004459 [Coniferiporia weirii]|nr:hypothetical protein M0805_004459 [Coniferiporia weirii]